MPIAAITPAAETGSVRKRIPSIHACERVILSFRVRGQEKPSFHRNL